MIQTIPDKDTMFAKLQQAETGTTPILKNTLGPVELEQVHFFSLT
jgi:hypothetical protein